jgi:pimeloyl-ACP methyl ester carboxylesterase
MTAHHTRRAVLASAAAVGATYAVVGASGAADAGETGGSTAIRPFRIDVPQDVLDDLRRRILATRFADGELVQDQSQGVQEAAIEALARYWVSDYDWRRCEARLNALPQFITEIDGLDIHFIHVRSRHANALPLIVTHGWPGSIIEQLKIIEPLTNPTAHGGNASDAFHVVIPSMPGYGFSARPTSVGWNADRIGRAWDTLMKRLGYERYVHQGGDWGARISEVMGHQAPPGLLGVHANLLLTYPPEVARALAAGGPPPAGLSEIESAAYNQRKAANPIGYLVMQARRPQTVGWSLSDSPVGLAAWLIDHDRQSYEDIARLFVEDRPFGAITKDDILDNITLYWATNTGASAARLYWEAAQSPPPTGQVAIPAAYTVFPGEIIRAPRSWVEHTFPNLIYYSEAPRGGHFAMWEEPRLFAREVRAAFRSLRRSA